MTEPKQNRRVTNEDLEQLRYCYEHFGTMSRYVHYSALVPDLFESFPELMKLQGSMEITRVRFEAELKRAKIELDEKDLELF